MNAKTLALGIGLLATSAFSDYIDFKSNAFSGADGQSSFNTTVGGVSVTLTAGPSGTALFWDAERLDGVAVKDDNKSSTASVGYEVDEIDGNERLTIAFNKTLFVQSISLTDLFRETRPGTTYNEVGYYKVGNGDWVLFVADNNTILPGSNGEKVVTVNADVTSLMFKAPGSITVGGKAQDHEYSVAGITYKGGNAVPEPSTLALFGLALVAAAGYRRISRK